MSITEYTESGMIFKDDEDILFNIEQSEIYKSIRNGVHICDFIYLKGNKLFIIEAKRSSPRPDNHENFEKFIHEITRKFIDTLILFLGMSLKRPYPKPLEMSSELASIDFSRINIILCLIINGNRLEWMPPINDALNNESAHIRKTFIIRSIIAINDIEARRKQLIH